MRHTVAESVCKHLAAALLALGACSAVQGASTDAPESDTAEAATTTPEQGPYSWDFSWTDWQGLSFYVSHKSGRDLSVNYLPLLDLSQVRFAGDIGGRLEVDAAGYSTSGNLDGFDSGVELRRARITARGGSIIGLPFSYRVDLGYVPGSFTVTQAYIQVPGVRYLGTVKFGQFTPPVGLQIITSSWDIPFMEPAAPLQALVPPSQPGLLAGDTYSNERGTWALGLYAGTGTDGEYGSAAKDFGNLVGRVTWLAVDAIDGTEARSNRYLHLGVGANLQVADKGQIQYRSRPESYLAPYVVDTGVIEASKAATLDAELLWVNGPLSVQGEVIASKIGASAGGNLAFYGLYALASWYLTGESRPYDRTDGKPGRLLPRRNFGFGPDAGWGAFEGAARVSYVDLSDGPVQGGRLTMLMGSLNWYLRPQLKCMFEVGTGTVRHTADTGNLLLAQLRLGVYFY